MYRLIHLAFIFVLIICLSTLLNLKDVAFFFALVCISWLNQSDLHLLISYQLEFLFVTNDSYVEVSYNYVWIFYCVCGFKMIILLYESQIFDLVGFSENWLIRYYLFSCDNFWRCKIKVVMTIYDHIVFLDYKDLNFGNIGEISFKIISTSPFIFEFCYLNLTIEVYRLSGTCLIW